MSELVIIVEPPQPCGCSLKRGLCHCNPKYSICWASEVEYREYLDSMVERE